MRLICPACQTVYETPDGAIGSGGRMVRCSNCGAEWMARGPSRQRSGEGERSARAPAPASPVSPPRVAPATATLAALTSEPEGTDPPRATAPRGLEAPQTQSAPLEAAPSPSQTRETLIRSIEPAADAPRAASGGRFMAGFATVTLLAAAAVAVYARHEDIAHAAPSLSAALTDYAAAVDRLRETLASFRDDLR